MHKINVTKFKEYNDWLKIVNQSEIPFEESWKTFDNFLKDVKRSPKNGFILDRKDRRFGYFKENVEWADKYSQYRNNLNNAIWERDGEQKTLLEWSEILKIKLSILRKRLKCQLKSIL